MLEKVAKTMGKKCDQEVDSINYEYATVNDQRALRNQEHSLEKFKQYDKDWAKFTKYSSKLLMQEPD